MVFMEILEWFDETGQEMVHKIPEKGSADIKFGAQAIVRENQAAVFLISNLEPRQLLGKIRQPYSSEMARDLIF
jgi:hypothetical protein